MKTCFKCKLTLPRTEFYAHPMMADGLLGKCKNCTKKDVNERRNIKLQDPTWLAKERARCRAKQERYRLLGIAAPKTPESTKAWEKRNRHKCKAEKLARRAKKLGFLVNPGICQDCKITGTRLQMHHEDYSKPLEVNWLCTKCHGKRHWKSKP